MYNYGKIASSKLHVFNTLLKELNIRCYKFAVSSINEHKKDL